MNENQKLEIKTQKVYGKKRVIGNSRRGFTLIELLMASGILMLLIGVFTNMFGSIIDAQLDTSATSSVDQDGKYIISRLAYDMQRATSIVTPSSPASTTSAVLVLSINGVNYSYSLDSSSNLQLNNDLGSNTLNSYNTKVQNLTFQRLGIGDASDTIQVKFNLQSRIRQAKGYENKDFQTTLTAQ